MRLFAGTSGFSYKEWKGSFYPQDLPAADMLAHYAAHLPAVEINNTFYRMPSEKVLAAWRASSGPDFRFVVKASRRITHFKRLKNCDEELGYLVGALAVLEERLGGVLFQLPPNFKKDLGCLAAFLDTVPERIPAAFEFRHPSWRDQEVAALLGERGRALCAADTEEEPAEIVETTGWGYLRLRRADYSDADLAAWRRRLTATGWERAFVFFKHEDQGAGPRLARRFLDLDASGRAGPC